MRRHSTVSLGLARAGLRCEQVRIRRICERQYLPDFIMSFTVSWPNTALEPTAFTPGSFRFGRRLAGVFRSRGSAFGR